MTPVEYVLDPRFEVIGCAVKKGLNGESRWLWGDELPAFFASLDPNVTSLVTHNALFDMCIVAWRYGFIPRLIVDTMGVARACRGHILKSLSLKSVALHLGLGVKGDTVAKVEGMSAAAIKAAGMALEYAAYSLNDVELCAGIYRELVTTGEFPVNELAVMDMVLRCAIEPKLRIDSHVLSQHLANIQAKKEHLLAQSMLIGAEGRTDLMSNERFAELLRQHGVEPPTKRSLATGLDTYAFAKTDVDFLALEDHENPAVQVLVSARLGHKSTLEETRTERLLKIANLQWPFTHASNLMPIPLRFSGAHTHRLSGDWKLNLQNLPARKDSTIRRALIAPPHHKVVTVDASQIEARITAWICGQLDLVEQFARGEDVYSLFASEIFQKLVTKNDKSERFVGKTGILGLGFGVGAPKFQHTVKIQSKEQAGTLIELSDEEAMRVVSLYRTRYHKIPEGWRTLNYVGIPALLNGNPFTFGPCAFERGAVRLPSGLKLHYHDIVNIPAMGWCYSYGGKTHKKLYGGSLLENIVQALARVIVMDAAIRIQKRLARYGIALALQVHDELVYVVPDALVEVVESILLEEMTRRPTWGNNLPLAAEFGVGPSYGDAK